MSLRNRIRYQTSAVCPDCGREFDLLDAEEGGDVDEYFNGHDCESETP